MAPLKFRIILVLLAGRGSQNLFRSLFGLAALYYAAAQDVVHDYIPDADVNPTIDMRSEWRKSDHLECDISTLDLTEAEQKQISAILNTDILKSEEIQRRANNTDFVISPHLVYRYLNSVDFAENYHGQRIEDAISSTVMWRDQFGISSVDTSLISKLVGKGLGYISNSLDKDGRAVIYLKVGRNDKIETSQEYLNLLMYTVERADRHSVAHGSGQFVAIVDLSGFSWSKCPPISMIKESIGLLKKHYPYRLGGVFIVNGGATFNFLWNIVKPIMPKRALLKTFVLNKKEAFLVLDGKIGREYFEVIYGGELMEVHGENDENIERYFQEGYWYNSVTTANTVEIDVMVTPGGVGGVDTPDL